MSVANDPWATIETQVLGGAKSARGRQHQLDLASANLILESRSCILSISDQTFQLSSIPGLQSTFLREDLFLVEQRNSWNHVCFRTCGSHMKRQVKRNSVSTNPCLHTPQLGNTGPTGCSPGFTKSPREKQPLSLSLKTSHY